MKIGVDVNQLTGSHAKSNYLKHRQLLALGADILPLKIPYGDYILITCEVEDVAARMGGYENIHKADLRGHIPISIDTKKDLIELCGNVCQHHERFKKELLKPIKDGNARLIILVEDKDIKCLADVYLWQNPRLRNNPKAVKGPALYKSLCTIRDEYHVRFEFCSRADTGKRIIELLTEEGECDGKE